MKSAQVVLWLLLLMYCALSRMTPAQRGYPMPTLGIRGEQVVVHDHPANRKSISVDAVGAIRPPPALASKVTPAGIPGRRLRGTSCRYNRPG